MSHLHRLIANSFPHIQNFEENVTVEIENLENARSFWSECYRIRLTLKNNTEKITSPLFIKVPRISETFSLLELDNVEENTQILLKLAEREVQFFNDFRDVSFQNFPIPRNFFAEDIDTSKETNTTGGLVFEDLGALIYSVDFIPGFTHLQINNLMESLAGFHFSTLSISDKIDWNKYNNDLYDGDYIKMLHHDTLDIENLRPELFAGKIKKLEWIYAPDSVEEAIQIDKEIGMPEVFSHNDLNASNIFWDKQTDKIFAFIDFQHLARGSIPFDIIRILSLGLSTEDRRNKTKSYLHHYYVTIVSLFDGMAPFTFDQLVTSYSKHFAFVNGTTLFGIYYYYKMYKEDGIDLSSSARNEHAEEILKRAIGIIEDIEQSSC